MNVGRITLAIQTCSVSVREHTHTFFLSLQLTHKPKKTFPSPPQLVTATWMGRSVRRATLKPASACVGWE